MRNIGILIKDYGIFYDSQTSIFNKKIGRGGNIKISKKIKEKAY